MLTPAELRRATADAALRLGGASAADRQLGGASAAARQLGGDSAAARQLGGDSAAARAEGTTLYCAFSNGTEVVLRNRLEPDAAFDRELLLNNMAAALLIAEGAREC